MQLSISTNFPEVAAALRKVSAEVGDKAAARTLNATVAQAKTAMGREIRQEFNLQAGYVRDRLRITRARLSRGTLSLSATLYAMDKGKQKRGMNLINFKAEQTAAGVSVKIKKAGSRKVRKGAFIGNKGRTVFERIPGTKMKSRSAANAHGNKLRAVTTIDVQQMFNTRRINGTVIRAIEERFPQIFERELAYALTQFNATR